MDELVIASDHAGFKLKQSILKFLKSEDIKNKDLGPRNSDSVDYPDYAIAVAQAVLKKEFDRGIIICGTGVGMSIVVNRFPGIRGTLCSDLYTAKLSRQHNDSNILILGGRVLEMGLANEIVSTWLHTSFEGGRHQRRLDKIASIEKMIEKGEM